MGAITVGEVKEAIRKLKNGKAPGEDGVCPEMLRAEDQETTSILQSILQDIWENETPPDDWNTGVIIKLPKKGNLGDCNNWRGITLLFLTSKIFSHMIHTFFFLSFRPNIFIYVQHVVEQYDEVLS